MENIHIGTKAPLNKEDSLDKTKGCRCFRPDNCKNCGTDVCAFANKERICYCPPKSWKTIYNKLKNRSNNK